MGRLTERLDNGQAAVFGCGTNCKYDFLYCINRSEDCPTITEIYEKLAHYEDLEEQGRLIVGHKDPVGEQGPEGKGRWIDNYCSICGMTPLGEEIWKHLNLDPPKFEYYMNYCPNCGAKLAELKGENK